MKVTMLRSLCVLILTIVCTCHSKYTSPDARQVLSLAPLWEDYKVTFGKKYHPQEEAVRHDTWESNVRYIQRHNLEYDLGHHTYTLGINEYADLSPVEYQKYLLGFRPVPTNATFPGAAIFHHDPLSHLPPDLDWRKYGYVTPIKNQGQCGSCWAFSSTGSLEGQHYRLTGRLVTLSEQNLVDCSQKFGNAGCNGGWMMNAFRYVQHNDGIDTEDSYPYEARDDSCRYTPTYRGADDVGYVMISKGDEVGLKAAVGKVGPVSVAIDATQKSFQLYSSGIYLEPNCSSTKTDHAVLVVGYGVEDGQDYWLVKNSWGTSWGLDGYIKMARNHDNQCAIASYACFPKM